MQSQASCCSFISSGSGWGVGGRNPPVGIPFFLLLLNRPPNPQPQFTTLSLSAPPRRRARSTRATDFTGNSFILYPSLPVPPLDFFIPPSLRFLYPSLPVLPPSQSLPYSFQPIPSLPPSPSLPVCPSPSLPVPPLLLPAPPSLPIPPPPVLARSPCLPVPPSHSVLPSLPSLLLPATPFPSLPVPPSQPPSQSAPLPPSPSLQSRGGYRFFEKGVHYRFTSKQDIVDVLAPK